MRFGGNTGIHDAHNLAWKLDAVVRGVAGPALLGTYELERRPVAEHTLAQALARLQAWFKDPSKKLPSPEKIIDDHWVIFGHRYRDGALIAERSSSTEEPFEDPRKPSGRLGSRRHTFFLNVEEAAFPLSICSVASGCSLPESRAVPGLLLQTKFLPPRSSL
jgi:FAD binding domain